MINVRLSQIYNNKPYYEIRKGRKYYNALGTNQVIKIVKDIRENGEKIKIDSIDQILEEHNKLIGLLK